VILTLLAILIAALAVLGLVTGLLPRIAVTAAVAGICVLIVALAVLASGTGATTLAVPIGPPGARMHLALDPLAASFLLLLFVVMPCAETAPLPLAATAVTVLAGDGFTMAVGLLLVGGVNSLRITAAAAVCLIAAFALAGPLGEFAALRAMPPEGWSAAGVLLLVLVGAGAMSRVSPVIAGYLVLRILFDLCGDGQPMWWGAPLLLTGALIAAIGSLRAALAETLHTVACRGSLQLFGTAAMALGVALLARAADLPSVTSLALEAAWLALVGHLLCRTLLLRCAGAAAVGAGTRRLDCLGGLIHRMPVTTGSCLVGLFAVAVLPPGLGFAAFWLLFQSLLAAARIGDPGLQGLIVGAAALAAVSVGLAALAEVRLFGVVFLGVPRTPRAAVADEAPRAVRCVLVGLAAVTALLGLLPGLALLPAAGWTRATDSMALLILHTGAETPGYSPVAVAGLLLVAGIAAMWISRRTGIQRREPVWSGGFAAPPSWLPFGDPATQYGPVSFSDALRRVVALPRAFGTIKRRLCHGRDVVLRIATAMVAPQRDRVRD
jgi:formate hydrogenlyase subunit 3/multisubunit Na+/H+ antiporter MnhD subunit